MIEFIGVSEVKSVLKGHIKSIFNVSEEKFRPMHAFTKILPEIFERLKTLSAGEKSAVFSELFKELIDALEALTVSHSNWRMVQGLLEVISKNQLQFE